MKSLYFTAGQFARLHQLNKRTLHYYDDIGLFSPAYKGENGYRYYTYQQSAQLENILAMRQLNMSIEEISSYLKHPNPQDFLEISQNKIQAIDQQIQQLQVLKQVFEQRQQSLVRSEQIHDGQIEVEQFDAHHYLLTPMPVEDNPMRNMQQIMQHLQSSWEHSSYKAGCGSYISLEKASLMCTTAFSPRSTHRTMTRCSYCVRQDSICADTASAVGTSCLNCIPA